MLRRTNNADGKPDTLQELALAIAAQPAARLRRGATTATAPTTAASSSAFMYRTDRVELLPARADDPVLGGTPTVDYRARRRWPTTRDVQNPKVLNAELPADVDRSTGSDGTNVYTRPAAGRPLPDLARPGSAAAGRSTLVGVSTTSRSTPNARVGQRTEQARYGAAIVEAPRRGGARYARVLFGGDLNVFPRPDDPFPPGDAHFPSDQLGPLYDGPDEEPLGRARRRVPATAYSYVFDGQAQTLDQQFVHAARRTWSRCGWRTSTPTGRPTSTATARAVRATTTRS